MHQQFTGLTMEHTTIAKWQAKCTHYIEIGGSEEALVETMSELIECPDSILSTEEVYTLLIIIKFFIEILLCILVFRAHDLIIDVATGGRSSKCVFTRYL